MNPGSYSLQVYRGDSYRWQFTLYDDVAQSTPSDLTDVFVASQIRDKPGGTLICSLACEVTAPNIVLVYLAPADSEKLPSSAVWDLQLRYPSGDVSTVLAGAVNVTADVTSLDTTPVVTPLTFVRSRAGPR